MQPSTTSRAGADEAVVLDDRRPGLHRLEHAADADAAREVHVPADLRAGADRRPGVDHRALADIGAEVDEGGHQHDARARYRPSGAPRSRHRAEAGGAPVVVGPALELRIDLVPPAAALRAARLRAPCRCRRKPSSTAFFAHWLTRQAPSGLPLGDAQRRPCRAPPASVSIAARSAPPVCGVIVSRASQAASMARSSSAWSGHRGGLSVRSGGDRRASYKSAGAPLAIGRRAQAGGRQDRR